MAHLRILVVCTANVCRSPMAAGLLAAHLEESGVAALVSSVGTRAVEMGVDPHAVQAAAELGVYISGHQPRAITPEIVADEGADLVITMTRQHLREVATLARGVFGRTFTLRELARLLPTAPPPPPAPDASLGTWLETTAMVRRAQDLLGDDPADDIADPFGTGAANVRRTARELDELTRAVATGLGGLCHQKLS